MGMILYFPNQSRITPALWLHGTSLLLVFLLIKRFGFKLRKTFLLEPPVSIWFLAAIIIGIVYWFVDHWLMDDIFGLNSEAAITSWHNANSRYYPLTVFISSVLVAPLFEEIFFRGLVFKQLSNQLNVLFAALFSALFFAAIHWSWPEFISLFVAALLYAYLLHRSQNLYIPLLAHIVHNLMTYMYFIQ